MSTIAATNHPKPAVYSVGLDPDSNREITLAAEANAMGFRIEGGFEGLQPEEHHSARGCLFVGPDAAEDLPESLLTASRLSVIAVLPSCPADRASQLMRQGLYAVVTLPLQQPALVELIVDAARQSELRHARLSENVGAIQRMGQATAKELEVLDLIIAGQKNREIAETLGITVRAVEDRRYRLLRKVGVDSLPELVALATTARIARSGLSEVNREYRSGRGQSQSCIKGIEIWTMSEEHRELRICQSTYRDAESFREATVGVTFHRGEGLPGKVWEQRAPVFLKELVRPGFVRSTAAEVVRMNSAIGIPCFLRQSVEAVIVFLLDDFQETPAAFESWRIDPQSSKMHLVDGIYFNARHLEQLTPHVHFPLGVGLPGISSGDARPQAVVQIGEHPDVIRSASCFRDGIEHAVTIPLTSSGSAISDVFVLLSNDARPVFGLIQIWKVVDNHLELSFEALNGTATDLPRETPIASEGSLQERCFRQQRPLLADDEDEITLTQESATKNLQMAIVCPTTIGNRVVAVTLLGCQ